MRSVKTGLVVAVCISFTMILGAGIYEHLAVVPKCKLAPPASLTMFQGKYGLDPADFWMIIHPVTLLFFLLALVANWKNDRRKHIAISFGVYVVVLAVTAIYYVPELSSIINTPYKDEQDVPLIRRAGLWEKLSLLRAVILIPTAGSLFLSLTKDNEIKTATRDPYPG